MSMVDKNIVRDLFVCSFKGTSPDITEFKVQDVKKALKEEIHKLAHDENSYRRNKLDLFEILQEAYDEIIPEYVGNFIGAFADIRQVPANQTVQFNVKRGRRRAKTFITEVGLSGVYEAFRLDVDSFTVSAKAIGGAAYIDFERSINGDEDIAESANLLLEGLQEAIYREIMKALIATVVAGDMPAANQVDADTFDAEAMFKLCTIAKSYGTSATIFATPEFVGKMGPDAVGMPVYAPYALTASPTAGSAAGYATPVYSPRDIEAIANTGYINWFRGFPIVQIPQNFTDENNDTYQIPCSLAYIMPTGGEKIVKVVFEGPTHVDDFKHRDRSYEVEVYKRIGVAIITTNNWCVYRNRELETVEYAITDEMKRNFLVDGGTWGPPAP